MKRITLIAVAVLLTGRVFAQEANWLTSFPGATQQASNENKLLLLDFTGSDWCGWCKKLDAETFSRPEFIEYAAKNLVLVQLDYPMHKPQSDELKAANQVLKRKYEVNGFPTVLLVKPDGEVLWQQVGYLAGGPEAMIAAVNQSRKAAGLARHSEMVAAAPAAPVTIRPSAPPPQNAGDGPKLQGILYSATHSSVVLNGKVCEEGEIVNGIRIVKITPDTVTVEYQGKMKVLRMN